MATISSTNFEQQEYKTPNRIAMINECRSLLEELDDGIYTIDWEGYFPKIKNDGNGSLDEKSIIITVETILELKRIFHFKKPQLVKNIKISNADLSSLEIWTRDQLIELESKLVLILHGICLQR
ncbi:MAG: hypothetical protein P0116_15930 [Candidatus Nitrosocosmicus sp.]|nr:hypothetical protein [Candidatus Nitrosocosmicus sp.]